VLRNVGDQVSIRESMLPAEVLVLPVELARVDALLDDRRSSPRLCRCSIRGSVGRRRRSRRICG
jgi:IS5 family transposase